MRINKEYFRHFQERANFTNEICETILFIKSYFVFRILRGEVYGSVRLLNLDSLTGIRNGVERYGVLVTLTNQLSLNRFRTTYCVHFDVDFH